MKEFLKVTTSLILFFAIALIGLTFARNFNRQPSVLLTSTQCDPPCWYGIQPGQSSTAQVYTLLDQIAGINKDTILGEINHYDQLVGIFWLFQRPVEDSMGSVNIDNDRAIAINISTVNSLTLKELFNGLGEPEQDWTGIWQRDDGGQFLDIVLLSPWVGYVAEVVIDFEPGQEQVQVKPTTSVFRVTYFAPEMYQELLASRILIDKPVSRRVPLQPWPGFGTISFQRE